MEKSDGRHRRGAGRRAAHHDAGDGAFPSSKARGDQSSADALTAYMQALEHTPRMSPSLEAEIVASITAAQDGVASAIAKSPAAIEILLELGRALEDESIEPGKYFSPSAAEDPDANVDGGLSVLAELRAALNDTSDDREARLRDLVRTLRPSDEALGLLLRRLCGQGGEPELCREVQAALDQLRHGRRRLVEANLRLVLWELGKSYRGRSDLEDLIQEGNMALVRAAELFDESRNVRFATYAIWWIRARVRRAVALRNAPVRVPLHVMRQLGELRAVSRKLRASLQREPTLSELARAAGQPVEKVRTLLTRSALFEPVSLHTPTGRDSSPPLEHAIADPHGVSALDLLLERELYEWVRSTVSELKDRERAVLLGRFGLDETQEPRSLAEIARDFGVSRERVRQIEHVALRRLVSGPRRAELAARWDADTEPTPNPPPRTRAEPAQPPSEPPPADG